ncbi:chromate efflux transporter [Diaphorobacter sp. HDW4A]|uniref:chromate efflux transporter n=1 Tax=Diaphorobacter sp. HDW4A TaxID=2714924 RepID=UPI00140A4510|nr:chromate efflux transporter [Diaphorobacter sp. HDW4A]QIL79344.1 chromate efflux transporter [Diaphorobacter sp. HDW4A]
MLEVFIAFLKLGLTSFGGPVAHLGYFRTEFVERRGWLDDRSYTDLVALCQFLPGPASSQVGMALGMKRAGWPGALAAWVGFTLPSAMALTVFAFGVTHWLALAQSGVVHGLKVVAVAVVAQAVMGMARSLCPDRLRAGVAIAAAMLVLLVPGAWAQIAVMALGALIGRFALRLPQGTALAQDSFGIGTRAGAVLLALFAGLLLASFVVADATQSPLLALAARFYQAGSLVFGGGHVVLPLLQSAVVPAFLSNDVFLAGYGAAQAVPGPLFTFAAYLGAALPASLQVWGGWGSALLMLFAIFLPAFLLVIGALPFWQSLRTRPGVQRGMAGVNAAVVGVLLAALYDPVWTSAIHAPADFALAVFAFGLLVFARWSPVWVVLIAAAWGFTAGF